MKNSLLHDLIRTSPFVRGLGPSLEQIRPYLQEATVFWVQNVADYLFEEDDKEEWSVLDDFPRIRPPFELVWLEWNSPDFIRSGGQVTPVTGKSVHGVLTRWTPTATGGILTGFVFMRLDSPPDDMVVNVPLPQFDYLGRYFIRVKETGEPEPWDAANPMLLDASAPENMAFMHSTTSLIGPALLAISFLHCRNVTTHTVAATRPAGKRVRRRGDGIKYTVLDIRPMQRTLRATGETTGLRQALHICRGHFKNYTAEKPLLGRYAGTFWWADQVRGAAHLGETRKDYEIKCP